STALQGLFEQFDQRQKAEEQRWKALYEDLSNRHKTYDADYDRRLKQVVATADSRQEQHLIQMRTVLEKASGFSDEVSMLAKTLQNIAKGEGKLGDLQAT